MTQRLILLILCVAISRQQVPGNEYIHHGTVNVVITDGEHAVVASDSSDTFQGKLTTKKNCKNFVIDQWTAMAINGAAADNDYNYDQTSIIHKLATSTPVASSIEAIANQWADETIRQANRFHATLNSANEELFVEGIFIKAKQDSVIDVYVEDVKLKPDGKFLKERMMQKQSPPELEFAEGSGSDLAVEYLNQRPLDSDLSFYATYDQKKLVIEWARRAVKNAIDKSQITNEKLAPPIQILYLDTAHGLQLIEKGPCS